MAQPSCFFQLRVRLGREGGEGERGFEGIVKGEKTMGELLEEVGEERLVGRFG